MSEYTYPDGIDCVWLACDHNGHLAAFTTAGVGPIPIDALTSSLINVEDVEEAVCQMPKVSQAHLLVQMKRPDDFVDMAERGFFVYDWRDIHRTTGESSNRYELIATPLNPISYDVLPASLAQLVAGIRFSDLAFVDNRVLDIYTQFECLTP
ncbi:MAG: hypothetical protein ACHP9Y_02890 [Gammaproteobacteria bacterium]